MSRKASPKIQLEQKTIEIKLLTRQHGKLSDKSAPIDLKSPIIDNAKPIRDLR